MTAVLDHLQSRLVEAFIKAMPDERARAVVRTPHPKVKAVEPEPQPMAVVSSELIPIQRTSLGGDEVNAVSGRDLHAFLEVGTAFKDWVTRGIEDFGFIEGQDFCSFLSESQGGRPAKEYAVSISMAKELAMAQRVTV